MKIIVSLLIIVGYFFGQGDLPKDYKLSMMRYVTEFEQPSRTWVNLGIGIGALKIREMPYGDGGVSFGISLFHRWGEKPFSARFAMVGTYDEFAGDFGLLYAVLGKPGHSALLSIGLGPVIGYDKSFCYETVGIPISLSADKIHNNCCSFLLNIMAHANINLERPFIGLVIGYSSFHGL